MNKTIIININGIVFHIEEDAYEVLKTYMTEVKRHFAYSTDSEEIVSDIENRIAEMFVERLEQEKKQVVELQDVQHVTAQMGSVKEFELEGDDADFITDQHVKGGKKLFRDMDDRVIAGVCSGVAHYFNIEPKWMRVFAFLIVFLGGSGLFIYLVLWIAMPKAKTRADKMAMKGEAPNLQNFKRNFDEEVEALHHNLKRAQTNADPLLRGIENFLRDLFSHLATFLGEAFRIFIKLIGGLIILVSTAAFLGIIVFLFILFGWGPADMNFPPFNAINPEYKTVLYLSAFLLAIIPVIALIFFAIRVLFNRTIITKTGSFTMLIIWLVALCMGAYYGTKFGTEFKEEASFSETVDLKASPVYYLKLSDTKYFTHADSVDYNISPGSIGKHIIINNDDNDWDHKMILYIERTDVDKPVLVETYSSKGSSFQSALKSAQGINYKYQQADSVITLDRTMHLSKNTLWRDQEVRLTLRVPLNTRLIFDGDMDWHLRDVNLWECRPEAVSHDAPLHMKMTAEGLKCDTLVNKMIVPVQE
jgi:phage shock protein PspC (stress-responsive transcriptional regulator)